MFQIPDSEIDRLALAIRTLLANRSGSICPSEATQRGVVLDPAGIWRGPVRVHRPRA